MAEYKAPASRKAIKSKVKALLVDWVDENLTEGDDSVSLWDEANDSAEREYQDFIEDGVSHAIAIKEAKKRFWEELRSQLSCQLECVFEELGE